MGGTIIELAFADVMILYHRNFTLNNIKMKNFFEKYGSYIIIAMMIPIALFISYKISLNQQILQLESELKDKACTPSQEHQETIQAIADIHYDISILVDKLNK